MSLFLLSYFQINTTKTYPPLPQSNYSSKAVYVSRKKLEIYGVTQDSQLLTFIIKIPFQLYN